MWKLYEDFEVDLQNKMPFDPMATIYANAPPPAVVAGQIAVVPPGTSATFDQIFSFVESARLSSSFKLQRRLVVANFEVNGSPQMRSEILSQGWHQEPAPNPAPAA
jgi:hypothetical protein